MKLTKIALVEIGGSHDECLLPQFVALKNHNCHITFVGTKAIFERNEFFHQYIDETVFISFTGKALADFKLMRNLNKHFLKAGIQKVVLNTAQGAHIRNLCFTASSKIEFVGIVHTLNKFKGSFTQKLIHFKIKKYLVLNDYFLSKITPPKGIQVESFYPILFPTFNTEKTKPANEIWVTVIGGVENRRKDLVGSIALMNEYINQNVKFIFLGKSDGNHEDVIAFANLVLENEISNQIVYFNHFIPADEFDAYLKKSDFIWPMVHPDTPSAKEYFRNQISGALNVAFGYKIPLLVHETYLLDWEDLWCSFPYNLSNFKESLDTAITKRAEMQEAMKRHEKFQVEFQEKKYLNFIFRD